MNTAITHIIDMVVTINSENRRGVVPEMTPVRIEKIQTLTDRTLIRLYIADEDTEMGYPYRNAVGSMVADINEELPPRDLIVMDERGWRNTQRITLCLRAAQVRASLFTEVEPEYVKAYETGEFVDVQK